MANYDCLQNEVASLHQGTKADQRNYFSDMIERLDPIIRQGPKNNCRYTFVCEAAGIGCGYEYRVLAFGSNLLSADEVEIISCKSD